MYWYRQIPNLIRLFCCVTILGGLTDSSIRSAEPLPKLNTSQSIRELSLVEARRGYPVELKGIVTYSDPMWGSLFIADQAGGMMVRYERRDDYPRVGQQLQVTGLTQENAGYPAVGQGKFTNSQPSHVPVPVVTSVSGLSSNPYQLVRVRGVIRHAYVSGGSRLAVQLADRGEIVQCIFRVSLPDHLTPESLVDSVVSITGIAMPQPESRSDRPRPILLVSQYADLQVEKRSPTNPFEIAMTPISDIPRTSEHRLLVRGTLIKENDILSDVFELQAGEKSVRVQLNRSATIRAKDRIEVLGFGGVLEGKPAIVNAAFRVLAPRESTVQKKTSELTDSDYLPQIQQLAAVRQLTAAEASEGFPIRFSATVIHNDPLGIEPTILHDQSAGIELRHIEVRKSLKPGQLVLIEGFTCTDQQRPSVKISQFTVLGTGNYPLPRSVVYRELMSHSEEGQWITIHGLIRRVEVRDGHWHCFVQLSEGVVEAKLLEPPLGPVWKRGTRLALTGVNISRPKNDFSSIPLLIVPNAQQSEIRSEAPANVLEGETIPIASIASLSNLKKNPGGIRVRGMVTYRDGQVAIIQDDTSAIAVRGNISPDIRVGLAVRVIGYPNAASQQIVLEEPIFEVLHGPMAVTPVAESVDRLLNHQTGSRLITVGGVVVDRFRRSDDRHVLSIQELQGPNGRQLVFPVILPANQSSDALGKIPIRSIVECTGVAISHSDGTSDSNEFGLYLRHGNDLVLLANPPWWNPDRIRWAGLAVMALLFGTVFVAVFQRRQVTQRNATLKAELEERTKLEKEMQEIVESANDVIFTLDEQGLILTFNAAGEQLTGYSRSELHNIDFHNLLTDNSPAVDFEQLKCQPTRFELVIKTAFGSPHTWEVSSRPVVREDQERVIHCIARDVTERKAADDELRRLYLLQTQQLENSPLAFIEWGPSLEILRWSKTAEKIFGWSANEAIGRTKDELNLVYPEDAQIVLDIAESLKEGIHRNTHNFNRNVTKTGKVIHVEWYNSTLWDESGRLVSIMSLAQDVTARVQEEENRRNLEDQVRQSQKMEAVGRLAGGVAHDFNNLLTVINGCSELLLRETRPEDSLHELANEIRSAGEQAAGLTRQLLGFARREITNPTALEINSVVRDVERMLRRLIGEHIELITELDPSASRIKADPGHMVQLLMNLAVNARDAMLKGGRLIVRTINAEEEQVLEVQDNGIGMDYETKARIFEPFFTTKPVGQATGIGLSTVHAIVERAQGRIEVDSELGVGTTFRILLPTCTDRPPAKVTGYSRRPDLRARETILIVEDEDLVRSLTQRVLEGKGYRVFTAPCPADAIDLHARVPGRIDLLLSDVVMPGMGGRELAEKLQQNQPDLKILFMSGYTSDEVLRQGIREDLVHFIQKPFAPDALLRKVRDVLLLPVSELSFS